MTRAWPTAMGSAGTPASSDSRSTAMRSARVCDEASEAENDTARETHDAASLLLPPPDGGLRRHDARRARESRHDAKNDDNAAKDAEAPWRPGRRCSRDQDQTESDSDCGDGVKRQRTRDDELLRDRHQGRRQNDADNSDGADTEPEHECKSSCRAMHL